MTAAAVAISPSRRRGQPLLALIALIGFWVGLRAVLLAAEVPLRSRASSSLDAGGPAQGAVVMMDRERLLPSSKRPGDASSDLQAHGTGKGGRVIVRRALVPLRYRGGSGKDGPVPGVTASAFAATTRSADLRAGAQDKAPPLPSRPTLAGEAGARRRRWSGDAWLFLRRGGGPGSLASLLPSYGASQYGGVIRRSFGDGPQPRSFAYLRVAGATGARDAQAAMGIGVRPIAGLPIAVLAEGRLQQGTQATRLRPALAAISEVPPVALPLGFEGNVYAQGGWVGGHDATAFFDAQATAERRLPLWSAGPELRLGGGIWSGGQKGAVRLDLGPRAAIRTTVKDMPVQLAVDWRFRVGGKALPGSGPALTLSTGF